MFPAHEMSSRFRNCRELHLRAGRVEAVLGLGRDYDFATVGMGVELELPLHVECQRAAPSGRFDLVLALPAITPAGKSVTPTAH